MPILRWFQSHRRLLLRVSISSALIVWLLLRIDLGTVIARWSNVNWLLLGLLIPGLYLLNTHLRTARLRTILQAHGLLFPFRWLWLVQLKSSFVVTFLPGGASGDLYRTIVIGREVERNLDSVSAVVLEKMVGLLAMMFLSIVSLFVGMRLLGMTAYANLIGPVSIVAGGLIFISFMVYSVVRARLISRWHLPFSFWNRLAETTERLAMQFRDDRMLLSLALLSVLLQLSIVLWYFIVARAMALDVSLIALMIAVPIVELLLAIPVSIGGIGVRDASLVVLMLPFGLSTEEIISLSLLVALTATLLRVLSGSAFLWNTNGQKLPAKNALEHMVEST